MIQYYDRGHPMWLDGKDWRYKACNNKVDPKKPCAKCGQPPTLEGYDACLGYVEGASSACCGHGIPDAEILISDDEVMNELADGGLHVTVKAI